ncbi:hypothetical protein DM860_015506 [Cuscuta australis]|uniref:Uncharacterized protein n=1 Tax=Cuscuta australis TaxID=267555 RepID=A0A328DIQ6_9ASTE|nr:hypothetical protein DM860_015506 [Cuscuta australis]
MANNRMRAGNIVREEDRQQNHLERNPHNTPNERACLPNPNLRVVISRPVPPATLPRLWIPSRLPPGFHEESRSPQVPTNTPRISTSSSTNSSYSTMSTREALTNVMDSNCPTFDGSGSMNGAHRWMRRVVDTFRDLGLFDDLRIQIAPELLMGAARVWWEVDPKYIPLTFFLQKRNKYLSEVVSLSSLMVWDLNFLSPQNFCKG